MSRSPESIIQAARAGPISRGRRWVPPPPGISPRRTSGSAKLAFACAIRTSQASAISRPPPRQWPWIAATTGTGSSSIRSASGWIPTGGLPSPVIDFRSAPAEKAFSPFPADHDDSRLGPDPFELRGDGGGNSAVIAFTGGLSSQIVVIPSTDGL